MSSPDCSSRARVERNQTVKNLIKFAGARRVLFLVDRNNLGRQTLNEFQQYVTPDDGRKFTVLYNVQHLASNALDPVSKVCITTIQRLFSMLAGEQAFDPALEERSLWDMDEALVGPAIAEHIGVNLAAVAEDLDDILGDRGGRVGARRVLGPEWRALLNELNGSLAARYQAASNRVHRLHYKHLPSAACRCYDWPLPQIGRAGSRSL